MQTYDLDTVSRSTSTGLRYQAPAFAPWIVRELNPPAPRPPRLLDRVREAVRTRHYSRRTEKAYVMALLLYGAGLRLLECCRLRVKDVDFASNQIVIRDGKGRKDRVTMLPAAVNPCS